jgi:hypothetical protein
MEWVQVLVQVLGELELEFLLPPLAVDHKPLVRSRFGSFSHSSTVLLYRPHESHNDKCPLKVGYPRRS